MVHELKILPLYFTQVKNGEKTFELRKNDRPYQVGDTLVLREFDGKNYGSRIMTKTITYILYGGNYGLDKDYCILGIR
ncbi:ASCH/PUA domain-containing protein [Clostridium sp. 1001283B150210_160208_E6]|jgi:hypothetical protein|uniref:Activating signal cointegrator n=1 Tax=Siphoviridae sp. cteLh2 TaxID=2825590 RepID=A0A8S5U5Y9_9CAUD|nr:ASCH/PUA domain-containing protein [Clostridium sp. 1001283B150210_160208_E6]DAF89829.1 MAG TPA: activating signal cointegrator [Siphoviridae sp. cteLh2]